jgi:hypothetical protein
MSRGTGGLIAWLAFASGVLIVIVTIGLEFADPSEGGGNPVLVLWQTFVATFSLGAPAVGKPAALALWFLLGVGGIFIVSALIGLLTSGLHRQLEQLRKGRSQVLEKKHTVILGWSDQIYTVITELVEANRSRRRSAIAILADEDKVLMEDLVRHRIPDTGKTRLVFRTGSPLDLADLEMVNLNEARSIIVLGPNTASPDDAGRVRAQGGARHQQGPGISRATAPRGGRGA